MYLKQLCSIKIEATNDDGIFMSINSKSIVVLISGGIDSTATIDYYIQKHYKVSGLHIQYNQPNAESEFEAVKKITSFYKIKYHIVNLGFNLADRHGEFLGRNSLFILIASALDLSFKNIAVGIHLGSTYYDCSQRFMLDMQELLNGYYDGTIQLLAPFMNYTKNEIFDYCIKNKVPIQDTYSCLKKNSPPCGECGSCLERKRFYEVERNLQNKKD
jgi:7-cyano-7-deazaguanine synthase